jgi:hypothetical protein
MSPSQRAAEEVNTSGNEILEGFMDTAIRFNNGKVVEMIPSESNFNNTLKI